MADHARAPILPIRQVWFNQYRHIRAFAAPEAAPAGPLAEPVRPRFFQSAGRWRSRAAFVREVAGRAPGLAALAARLAATLPPMGGLAARGVAEGQELSELLSGAYPANAAFAGQAVVRSGAPPCIELPGGAQAWILAPTPDQLGRLYETWREYLAANGLGALLQVRGTGAAERRRGLVPAFVEALMMQRPGALASMAVAGRREDLAAPIEALAARPFEEDTSPANGSSIAILFEFAGRRLLAGRRRPAGAVAEGLRRLGYSPEVPVELDALKLAHHGSRANTMRRVAGAGALRPLPGLHQRRALWPSRQRVPGAGHLGQPRAAGYRPLLQLPRHRRRGRP